MIMLQLPVDSILDRRRKSRHSLASGWSGIGWQGYSLGILEGTWTLRQKPVILPKCVTFVSYVVLVGKLIL